MKPTMEEKIEWMLLAWAIGDALGVPLEMRTRQEIREKFGRVTDFLPTKNNGAFLRAGFNEEGSGYYSDDTVLTFATLKSLAHKNAIDFPLMADLQVQAAKNHPYGFGKNTLTAFDRLEQGISHLDSWVDWAGWNGVMMKQSPLAAFEILSGVVSEEMMQHVAVYARMTHGAPEAVVAALVHHKLLVNLLLHEWNIDGYAMLQELRAYASQVEDWMDQNGAQFDGYDTNDSQSVLEESSVNLENRTSRYIDRVLVLTDSTTGRVVATDEDILHAFDWGNRIGASCYVLTTLGIVYSLFFRNQSFETMLDAINIGGDTDSYGSILGNMIGALKGEFYAEEYLVWLQDHNALMEEVRKFLMRFDS